MIISKKMWIDSWTNCHVAKLSQIRSKYHESSRNDSFQLGIAGYLSVTRISLFDEISPKTEICDSCKKCLNLGWGRWE